MKIKTGVYVRIPYEPKRHTLYQSDAYKKRVEKRRARSLRLSNYSNFVTDLTRFLETRYQCEYQNVYRSMGFVSLRISSKAINLQLSFKPKHSEALHLTSIVFKEDDDGAAEAFFDFLFIAGKKYGIEDYHIVRPTGIPESFFEARKFVNWENGVAWKISIKNLAESLDFLQ